MIIIIVLGPGESVDAAYRRLVKELVVNGTFKAMEENRYRVPKREKLNAKKRQWMKTKRKRAQARRKVAGKRA
ncbi:MAG: hypothetical protein ACOCXT_03975 [Candidatus Dojkabacteria bacterium]